MYVMCDAYDVPPTKIHGTYIYALDINMYVRNSNFEILGPRDARPGLGTGLTVRETFCSLIHYHSHM